jgi:hypothetical protein
MLIDQNLEYNTKIYHPQKDQYEIPEDLKSEDTRRNKIT